MKLWIARDKDNTLCVYDNKPTYIDIIISIKDIIFITFSSFFEKKYLIAIKKLNLILYLNFII